MKRLIIALMLVLLPCSAAWSASFTSKAAGNWSASGQTTWNEAGVPGDGDTVTISHAVTVDTATTIGTSGASGTAAITTLTATSASLTVSAPLTVKGDIVHGKGVTIYGIAGGSITFSPPPGSTYVWKASAAGSGYATLNVAGSSLNRFAISTTQGGGGNFYFHETDAYIIFLLDYAVLDYVGDDTTPAMSRASLWNGGIFEINHTLFNHCGAINRVYSSGESIANIKLQNSDFRNSLETGSSPIFRVNNNTAPTTSTRIIENVTVYAVNNGYDFDIGTLVGATVRNIYMYNASLSTPSQSASNIFSTVDSGYGGGAAPHLRVSNQGAKTYSDMVFLANKDNPHYIDESSTTGAYAANIYTGIVFDGNGYVGTDAGDCLVVGGGDATIQNSISINKAGTLATLLRSNSKLTAINNTSYDSYHITVGESVGATTHAKDIRNNLFVNQNSGVLQEGFFKSQTAFTLRNNAYYDMTAAGNIDYGGNNTYMGAETKAVWWASGVYGDANKGSNDTYINPQFYDATRTVRGYGGWATVQEAAREMVTINGFDYTGAATTPTTKTVELALAYIREGFTPQNLTTKTIGDGGTFVGAVDPAIITYTSGSALLMGW